jgi:hypothetical protein
MYRRLLSPRSKLHLDALAACEFLLSGFEAAFLLFGIDLVDAELVSEAEFIHALDALLQTAVAVFSGFFGADAFGFLFETIGFVTSHEEVVDPASRIFDFLSGRNPLSGPLPTHFP